MPTKLKPINAIVSVHVHSTESEEKVLKAIKNILPRSIVFENLNLKREEFTGHHGNRIVRIEIALRRKEASDLFFYLMDKLRNQIYSEWFSERFEMKKNKFYLRLDKQSAYLGNIRVGSGDDVIKIIFSFPGYMKMSPMDFEKKILEEISKPKVD